MNHKIQNSKSTFALTAQKQRMNNNQLPPQNFINETTYVVSPIQQPSVTFHPQFPVTATMFSGYTPLLSHYQAPLVHEYPLMASPQIPLIYLQTPMPHQYPVLVHPPLAHQYSGMLSPLVYQMETFSPNTRDERSNIDAPCQLSEKKTTVQSLFPSNKNSDNDDKSSLVNKRRRIQHFLQNYSGEVVMLDHVTTVQFPVSNILYVTTHLGDTDLDNALWRDIAFSKGPTTKMAPYNLKIFGISGIQLKTSSCMGVYICPTRECNHCV